MEQEKVYQLARKFKETVRGEFIPQICCPSINWEEEYKIFRKQYGLNETDISPEEFEKL